jgi:hypothetical protein
MEDPAKSEDAPKHVANGITTISLQATDMLGTSLSEWVLQAESCGE